MIQFPITIEGVPQAAEELRRIRLIMAHQAGWPPAPDPVGIARAQSGVETDMGIKIKLNCPAINDMGLEPAALNEIDHGRWTPFFDDVPQTPIDNVPKDNSAVEVLAPQGVNVYGRFHTIDNAGNPSLGFLESNAVVSTDQTPPVDPVGTATAVVGEEVPD